MYVVLQKLTSTNHQDRVRAAAHRIDVPPGLEQVRLAGEGLGHDGPHAAEARGGDEVVVRLGDFGLRSGVEDRRRPRFGVDLLDAAVDEADVGPLQDLDVGEVDPALVGVLLGGEGQGGSDDVDYLLYVCPRSVLHVGTTPNKQGSSCEVCVCLS